MDAEPGNDATHRPRRMAGTAVPPGAILLAAGGSSRLGAPKQLLVYNGQTLLRRAAEAALATPCWPVIVVLGAGAARHREELAGLNVTVVENPAWERGMGCSVRRGMAALDNLARSGASPGVRSVLLTLCDQPLVGADALRKIVTAAEETQNGETIAAAAYEGTTGVPVLFGRAHFVELRTLPDDAGAKPLLRRHAASIIAVPLSEAAADIDTRAQYERLKNVGKS